MRLTTLINKEDKSTMDQFEIGYWFEFEGENKKAFYWYSLSAEKGFAPAQNNLGLLHEMGMGIKQDYKAAFDLYILAAKQGHAQAQTNIARLYIYGDGVAKDVETGLYWLKKSAAQDNEQAYLNMNAFYREAGDYKESLKWLNVYEERRDDAEFRVTEKSIKMTREYLENELTEEEIAEAAELAKNWEPEDEEIKLN